MDDSASTSPPAPFRLIQNRVAELHWRWRTLKQLFVDDEERKYGLMRRTAPMAFAVIQQALFDDVVLRVCKLADRPEGGPAQQPRENLVLERFVKEAEQSGKQHAADARTKLRELRRSVEHLRTLRNRCIAHEDFETATSPQLPDPIEYETVDRTIQVAIETARQLEDGESPYMYEWLQAPGDGNAVLGALEAADKYRTLRPVLWWLRGLPDCVRRLKERFPEQGAELELLLPPFIDEAIRREL